jgi:hypothetical protein
MTKPLIQIDDIGTTREMTEEEEADFYERYKDALRVTDETTSAD